MAGLLEFLNTPQGIGLLSAAAGGLAGARRGTPINNIGRGAVSGLMGYSNAQDQIRQDEENAFAKQYKQMQMEQMQAAMAKQKGEQAWRAGLPAMMKPKLTGTSEQGNMLADQQAAFGAEGVPSLVDSAQYAQPNAPLNMSYGMDKQGLQDYMMQADSPYAEKIMENMLMPSTEKPQLVTVYDEQGKPMQKWLRPGEADGITVGMGKPDTASQSSVGQMIAEMNRLSPGDPARQVYQQAIRKATTHAPAASMISYGSPVPAFNPQTGKVELVQFGNKPGASPTPTGYEAPPTRANGSGPMSVTLQKELIEADDAVRSSGEVTRTLQSALKINNDAYSGYGAKTRAVVRSNLPFPSKEANATVDLDNMMTGQALESLKLVFGGMPTEGERKILLDMQASADKTPAQRKAIIDRAIAATQRRQQFAKAKAEAIRNGKYLTEGAAPAEPAKPAPNGGWGIQRVD